MRVGFQDVNFRDPSSSMKSKTKLATFPVFPEVSAISRGIRPGLKPSSDAPAAVSNLNQINETASANDTSSATESDLDVR